MSTVSDRHKSYCGSIVAIEGDALTIATQLHLLPPSSRILILPPLADGISAHPGGAVFNAHRYVRDVHRLLGNRYDIARSFLRASTDDQPRFVFMHGGCASAITTCLRTIRDEVTHVDIDRAKAWFADIVKDGVSGLLMPEMLETGDTAELSEQPFRRSSGCRNEAYTYDDIAGKARSQHPSAVAMKAADLLDRDTASLQSPAEHVFEHYDVTDLPPDSVVVLKEISQTMRDIIAGSDKAMGSEGEDIDVTPYVSGGVKPAIEDEKQKENTHRAGSRKEYGDEIQETVITLQDRPNSEIDAPYGSRLQYSDDDFYTISHTEIEGDPPMPFEDQRLPASSVSGVVKLGEDCLLDVESANLTQSLRKVRFGDFNYPGLPTIPATNGEFRCPKSSISEQHLETRRSTSSMENGSNRPESVRSENIMPQTILVNASTMNISSPSPAGEQDYQFEPRIYTDCGTDTDLSEAGKAEKAEDPQNSTPFLPVFPVVEDLVIHFLGSKDDILESVILSYEKGTYPVSKLNENLSTESSITSTSDHASISNLARPSVDQSRQQADVLHDGKNLSDSYNPETYPLYPGQIWSRPWKPSKITRVASTMPPTPSTTPPPQSSETVQKFYDFSFVKGGTVVDMQNSFRTMLRFHFPSETMRRRQFSFNGNNDCLWRSIFGNNDGSDHIYTVDQIIAIGREDSVKASFSMEISGLIERFGIKKGGETRTGKLDIRYLITNAVQAYALQPLATQVPLRPVSDPRLLAILIVPQLESYLLYNISTRFLVLEYPASYFSVVIALRELLGPQLIKIAAIVNSMACDALDILSPAGQSAMCSSYSNRDTTHPNNSRSNSVVTCAAPTQARLQRDLELSCSHTFASNSAKSLSLNRKRQSFSTADFVLHSTATEAEITTFLANIWGTLLKKSSFYAPDSPSRRPCPILVPPPIPPTPAAHTSEHAPRSPVSLYGFRNRSGSMSKASKADQFLGALPSNNIHSSRFKSNNVHRTNTDGDLVDACHAGQAPSYPASIMKTTATATFAEEKERRTRQRDKEWERFDIGDDSDEEISRMMMPPVFKPVTHRGNSKKALKWLGIA